MAAARKEAVLRRNEIEDLIAQGRKIVVVDGRVLKVDAWLPYHPGGDKAILHMVGRDATNEVKAFHSFGTQEFMLKYQIGSIEGSWVDFVPPIQGGSFMNQEERARAASLDSDDDRRSRHSSSSSQSSEPPPVFDSPSARNSPLRRRKAKVNLASEYSSTSVSSLELDDRDALPKKVEYNGEDQTLRELRNDLEKYPSLDPTTQAEIIDKYKQLDQKIRNAGLYNCNYTAYLIESIRYTALALLSYYFLSTGWYPLSATFLGLFWHQLVFTVHDAGHMGITHNFHIDSCIGMFIANYLGGLSCCWWKRNHNVHHIVTNSAEHDPDIQHMPFFAVTHRFFQSLKSTYYDRIMTYDVPAQFLLKFQHYLYYPILTFGRFNLYFLSWQYIIMGQGPRKGPAWWHRWFELAGQIFFWYWFGYQVVYKSIPTGWDRFAFVMISHAMTMPVHVQITLSHFAMSTSDLGVAESFPQRMLRTTMDVDCPPWLDFVHGGLQFQAVHHLYPRIPRHNLRAAQKLVIEYCNDVKIPYAIYGFAEGNGKVIGRLAEVAKQAKIMSDCQKTMTAQSVLEGH